jgi:hypothetical protein
LKTLWDLFVDRGVFHLEKPLVTTVDARLARGPAMRALDVLGDERYRWSKKYEL